MAILVERKGIQNLPLDIGPRLLPIFNYDFLMARQQFNTICR
jgi:hypothetical protein